MEFIKWAISAIVGLAVVSAGIAAALAVAAFMFAVQLWGLFFMVVVGVAITIKEVIFKSKDE